MTRDESRAINFVAVLLLLAMAARFINRPKPITIMAGPVDLQALQAAGRALAQPKPRGRAFKRPLPTATTTTTSTSPKPWTVPAWQRSRTPPVFIIEPDRDRKAAGPININRATVEQLDALPGVGPAVAKRIVAKRDSLGRFQRIEDLDAVKGIGPSLLAKLRPLITLR